MVKNKSFGSRAFDIFNIAFLGLFAIVTIYPFWYILIASFNSGPDFLRGGVYIFPRVFTLANYRKAFEADTLIYDSLKISLARTLLGTFISVSCTAMFAYALHVRSLPGRTGFVLYFFFTTLVGGGMIPYFLLLRFLGLTKSFFIYIWPSVYSFFNMILVRTYFDGIDSGLRESAIIDGAGELRVLFRIYLPLSTPVLATIALFVGVGHWNDWFTAAYYLTNTKLWPAATILQRILTEATASSTIEVGKETMTRLQTETTPQSLQMAFVMLLTMPIVVVYPFLQKYYVKGVMIGAIKG